MMKKATAEEAVAVTSVFWDIKMFPVPPGFDARRVGPCIKRLLEKYGYFGPLTINAVGLLTDVHDDILGALSSSGINTYYGPFGASADIMWLFYEWTQKNPPPTNILAICDRTGLRPTREFNIFGPFSYSSPRYFRQEDAINWISLILAESEAVGEDTCSETGEYFCSICYRYDHPGQGFESFKRHLSSLEHTRKKLALLHPRREMFEEDPTIVRFQPEASFFVFGFNIDF
ncbi:hypothetical protein V5N11_034349 [Cardamine amara subsp. amara]|uniref:NYN domain-containing protein n=1 Tax=Cardamine amara subsp. amara TaxID=228776 RepID=A0ABD1C418_CARAN